MSLESWHCRVHQQISDAWHGACGLIRNPQVLLVYSRSFPLNQSLANNSVENICRFCIALSPFFEKLNDTGQSQQFSRFWGLIPFLGSDSTLPQSHKFFQTVRRICAVLVDFNSGRWHLVWEVFYRDGNSQKKSAFLWGCGFLRWGVKANMPAII